MWEVHHPYPLFVSESILITGDLSHPRTPGWILSTDSSSVRTKGPFRVAKISPIITCRPATSAPTRSPCIRSP